MFRGIYAGASAMLVQTTMLDVVGNNLANVDTSGFRGRVPVNKSFPEVLMDRVQHYPDENGFFEPPSPFYRPGSRVEIGSIALADVMSETYMMSTPGAMQHTNAPLDLALQDDGFFVIQDGAGNTFYTRSGQFQKSATGQLVTHNGMSVLGGGGPLEIGDSINYFFDDTGQLYVDNEAVGQVQVVRFDRPTYLKHEGKSLLSVTDASGGPIAVEDPRVAPGFLEMSNVQVVTEMVRMIEANRAYEAASKVVTIQDESAGRMNTAFGKG